MGGRRVSGEWLRAAIDIGGTFTDLVAIDPTTGACIEAKVPTTPRDFARGVVDVLVHRDIELAAVDHLIHGTTVVINAITERSGVRTALVTTRGFRDALAIGRGNRPDMYNLKFRKPEPFVPRSLRFEVDERVRFDGSVLRPLDAGSLDAVAEACLTHDVRAVAICFLHSYANPEHERLAKARLRELLPGVAITVSSEITREWREFERASTAVLNAYVQPIADTYLRHLDAELDALGAKENRLVMTSNGGTATFGHARGQPIHLVESGPAGGVIGAQVIGERMGESNIITLDIGGTTAKCSIIVDDRLSIAGDYRLEWTPLSPGYPVKIPVIDIVEIGAGGGSIIWFDAGGALKIGPKSAGADPGPACYGLGGDQPTITDAMVVAGYIPSGPAPGEDFSIDPERASAALAPVGRRLGVPVDVAVRGVLTLFTALTVDALKLVSVRRGHDPRDFSLVAFGGGGPLHAAVVGRELGARQIIIPPMPATFSAWGMLHADPRVDLVRTRVSRLDGTREPARNAVFAAMEAEARASLLDQGLPASSITVLARALDMRYHGQEHTVRVALADVRQDDQTILRLFNTEHKRLYTFALEDTPVEIVNFRVTATAQLMSRNGPQRAQADRQGDLSPGIERVIVGGSPERLPSAVYERSALPGGFRARGPALVREEATTTVIPPGHELTVDSGGNLVIVAH
jgi:N-methylhydantoinase A